MKRSLPAIVLSLLFATTPGWAEPTPEVFAKAPGLVLIFVPAYEGSALYDPGLAAAGKKAPCVWGSVEALRHQELYFALRMPNRLEAKLLLSAGGIEVYRGLVDALTDDDSSLPDFKPRVRNQDFFTFAYDWRQEISKVTAPELGRYLQQFPPSTHFVIVAHSMGGLVVRTLLSQRPNLARRIERVWLVGTPHHGSAKALKTLLTGPGGLRENDLGFPANLLKLLPNSVDAPVSRLVAITRPSLYELLPQGEPHWEVVDEEGHSRLIAEADFLRVGTWQKYWPTAEAEQEMYLKPWRAKFMGDPGEPLDPKAWEFCQDRDFVPLQTILASVRDWRQQMISVPQLSQLLTRSGESSRLRLVAGIGRSTPTGIISEGVGDACKVRYTYDLDADGDETVTTASALGGLTDARQILFLPQVPHAKLVLSPIFLKALKQDLILLNTPVTAP